MSHNIDRRTVLLGGSVLIGGGLALAAFPQAKEMTMSDMTETDWANLTQDQWRERLTEEEFRVLRKEGTERAGTSPLNKEKREGTFVCAGCGWPQFSSKTKYESGTGWPSFYDTLPNAVGTKEDNTFFMKRTEYHCARCGGHQGHVFNDGPSPTGLRYCNNGVALDFKPKEQA